MEQEGDGAHTGQCQASCEVVPNAHGKPPCLHGDQGLDPGGRTPTLPSARAPTGDKQLWLDHLHSIFAAIQDIWL